MKINPLRFLPIAFIFLCCRDESETRFIVRKTSFGEIAKGNILKDSVFDGLIKYYDLTDSKYLGYTTFKNGYENGPMVRYKGQRSVDSVYYEKPLKHGYEYLTDESGHITYTAYIIDGRVVGPVWHLEEKDKVHFYFYNFEGDIIYECKYDSLGKSEKGSSINFKVHDREVNDVFQTSLFLYMIKPHQSCYYEVGIFDNYRKVLSVTKISGGSIYKEISLPSLLSDQHYGIIYHDFDIRGREGKIIIQEIYL